MSKELTPLEALKEIKTHYNDRVCIDILEDFDIIEKGLKEYERLKKLYKLEEETSKHLNDTVLLLNEEVNKQLKALEIIKEGIVATPEYTTMTWNGKKYIELTSYIEEKEFDLLKEVLK